MAQRTIHYLIGEELIRGGGIRDIDRFRIGNLLPDAIEDLVFRDLTPSARPISSASAGTSRRSSRPTGCISAITCILSRTPATAVSGRRPGCGSTR